MRKGRDIDTLHVPNDVTASINGGLYIGHKWGNTLFYYSKDKTRDQVALNAGGFLAPTIIAISEKNTYPVVRTAANELGISIGGAFLFSFGDINLGILTGIDIPVSGESEKWVYANRPWLGIGIGYKLGILGK
ncbi:MAG TPA: hypothetical protein VEB40_10550, partial [Flavipsychrobacter sp.]|nr:hypothetical protein [Flavipsychrobacter sp.]